MMNRLKILHLEDVSADAELAERELKKAALNFEKLTVDNEYSFIKALKEFNPNVIISDHSLPSFSSIKALQIVKEKKLNIPFILLTATVSEEFAVDILNQGASDYILKDRIKRLPAAVLNAIERDRFEKARQKNLEKIIESRELMKAAERLAQFGSWEINLKTFIIKCSEGASLILDSGHGETMLSVEKFLNKIYKEDALQIKAEMKKALRSSLNSFKLNFRIIDKNGAVKYIATQQVIKRNETQQPIRLTGFCQDITENKKAEKELHARTDELRELAAHLQNIREEERAAIAREIHDELGQQLTGLKMDMSWIIKKMSTSDDILKQKIENSVELLSKTINVVRKIATELHPSILDDLGLIDAIQWQSHEFEKRSGIKTEFNYSFLPQNPGKNIITGIFRIYQESLTNIARHAGAEKIFTKLEYKNGQIILNIRDNGKGFDVLKFHNKKTLGILSMKERTLMMGGKYIIRSEIGKGTSILVSVPYTNISK
jgi:two-component system sensor histidine kinase UhpB